MFETMESANNRSADDGRRVGPVEQSTNDAMSGGLPAARSIEEALARIETAVDDLAGLTDPGVLEVGTRRASRG